jgi:nitroimidazol reductase NimA-like FMN-containing flavoprotein (pyridoxamine 5'-phosphate oxidase superfamily)
LSNVLSIWDGRKLTSEEIDTVLREAKIARFCSLNQDGTIHATPVWFNYEHGKIVILTPSKSQKVRNVKQQNKVTVLVDLVNPPRGVIVYGTAELDDQDVITKGVKVAQKYLPKEKAPVIIEDLYKKGMDLLIRVTPYHMTSFLTH